MNLQEQGHGQRSPKVQAETGECKGERVGQAWATWHPKKSISKANKIKKTYNDCKWKGQQTQTQGTGVLE